MKIRGGYYYQIGKNAYVNCANVYSIAGHMLYTSQARVTIQNGFAAGEKNNQPYALLVPKPNDHVSLYGSSKKPLKVGQKVTIDGIYYNQEMSNVDQTFYRIKGTSGSKTQIISTDYIHRAPRQQLETVRASSGLRTKTQTPVYDAAGQVISRSGLHKNYIFGSFEKVWLWVPSAHKAELFYQMSSRLWSTQNGDPSGDYQSGGIRPYLPASDVTYDEGPTLKAVNTAAEAQTDAKVATSADKQELRQLINERDTVTSSTAYRLDPNDNYLGSLIAGQRILKDQTATVNQVIEEVRYIQRVKNSLNGRKIIVKNINHLTRQEAELVSSAVREYYFELHYYDQNNNDQYRVNFNSDRGQMTLVTQHYQDKKNQEPQYLVNTTSQVLKISDYAEQK